MSLLIWLALVTPQVSYASHGTCTGASPTWTAASADFADVIYCMQDATTADTVNVPAGPATWSGTFNTTKRLNIIGAGQGLTNITLSTNLTFTDTTGSRFSGFTLDPTSSFRILCDGCTTFRFDHLTFTRSSHNTFIEIWGSASKAVEGLIDHNTVTNGRILFLGDVSGLPKGAYQWAQPLDMGSAHAVYVEDNVFHELVPGGPAWPNSVDGNYAERIVARFNTFNSGRIEVHGIQANGERAPRLWEFYGNLLKNDLYGANYNPFFIRGGTGVVFHNNTDGGFSITDNLRIDGPRQSSSNLIALGAWGFCDGASFIDENTATFEGWHCRDQIGTSTDASQWVVPGPVPAQAVFPAYFWKNVRTDTSAELGITMNCGVDDAYCTRQNTLQILNNRDFSKYNAAFDGTSGIGEGTIAARPATCTYTAGSNVGVAYWVTNVGPNWNTSSSNPFGVQQNGADGYLSRCIATNTWTTEAESYVPYTYPHPLQGAGAPTVPSPQFRPGLNLRRAEDERAPNDGAQSVVAGTALMWPSR